MTKTMALDAGTLRCVADGADVRDLRIGAQRVLTRLYIAVGDVSWNTVPLNWVQNILEKGSDSFKVELSCLVDQPPMKAEWTVTVAGSAAGEFSYVMRGRTLGSFRFNKLGLNLHHPVPESVGARYVAHRGDKVAIGKIPDLVEPQFLVDGKLAGRFMPYDELALQCATDNELVFRFTGDKFEMQDHHNWTDYNLKSYGTPFEVPLPLSAEPGQVIELSVLVDVRRPGRARCARDLGRRAFFKGGCRSHPRRPVASHRLRVPGRNHRPRTGRCLSHRRSPASPRAGKPRSHIR